MYAENRIEQDVPTGDTAQGTGTDRRVPLVSVCIPVYNGEKYIEPAVASVLSQNHPNVEILVQDNASVDGTWERLQFLLGKHPQLSIRRNDRNIGMAPNWNRVMKRARGEYVMLLSADDMLERGFLRRCVELFGQHDVDAVTTDHYWLRNGLKRRRRVPLHSGLQEHFAGKVMLLNPFSINFTVFRRATIEEMSRDGALFSNLYYACDYDLWLRLALSGRRVYYAREALGSYRVHEENISRHFTMMNRQALLIVLSHKRALSETSNLSYRITLIRFVLRLLRNWFRFRVWDKRSFRAITGELLR